MGKIGQIFHICLRSGPRGLTPPPPYGQTVFLRLPFREEEEYSLQPTCFSGQARTLSTHTYDQRGIRSSSPYLTIREDCGGNRSAQWLFALDPTHHTDIEY